MALVADVKRAVARRYKLPLAELTGDSRRAEVARPRQIAMTLSCVLTRHTQKRVGQFFHRDHTTVLHARRQVARRASHDEQMREDLLALIKELR
jgi:chromosomal replication initiator protein